jgi:hypothetical protein
MPVSLMITELCVRDVHVKTHTEKLQSTCHNVAVLPSILELFEGATCLYYAIYSIVSYMKTTAQL